MLVVVLWVPKVSFTPRMRALQEDQFTEPFAASQGMLSIQLPSSNFLKFWCA